MPRALASIAALVLAPACAASRPDPALLADVPLESVSGLPLVEVRVGGSEPLRFLVDTGFDVSLLDAGVAARLGLAPDATRAAAQPGGAVEMGALAPVVLRIGALELDDVALTSAPLAGLAPVIGGRIDGILGHDVLARHVVELDPAAGRLRLADAARWEAPADAAVLPLRIVAGEPLAEGVIELPDGRRVAGWFKLDTGSLDVAGLNLNFVREHALVGATTPELVSAGLAIGGATEGRVFRARAFELGPLRAEAPLLAYTVDSGGFENRADAGTVGVQVLARARLILDYGRSRALLRGPYAPPPPEDRSGMFLLAPASGELVVGIVMGASPAAEAGLATGDRVLELDGRRGVGLREARERLRRDGAVSVTYERDGLVHETTVRCRALLPSAFFR